MTFLGKLGDDAKVFDAFATCPDPPRIAGAWQEGAGAAEGRPTPDDGLHRALSAGRIKY